MIMIARHGLDVVGLYTPEYKLVLALAKANGYVVPPNDAGKKADDKLIRDFKDAGMWQGVSRFYNHHTTGDRNYAGINYKNASVGLVTQIATPTYATKGGFSGNGTSMYLNYNWNPFTDNLSAADMAIALYIGTTNTAGARYLCGCNGGTSDQLLLRLQHPTQYVFAVNGNATTVAGTPVFGMHIIKRINSTDQTLSLNGGTDSGTSSAVGTKPNFNFYGLCRNNAGTPSDFDLRRIDCMIMMKGTLANSALINTIWNNHRTLVAAA